MITATRDTSNTAVVHAPCTVTAADLRTQQSICNNSLQLLALRTSCRSQNPSGMVSKVMLWAVLLLLARQQASQCVLLHVRSHTLQLCTCGAQLCIAVLRP
jgi:hypothetical protein